MMKTISVALAFVAALAFSPAWAQPVGLKKTVAVESFGGSEVFGGQVASDGPPALLTEILMTDGRFVVVERAALSALWQIQHTAESSLDLISLFLHPASTMVR